MIRSLAICYVVATSVAVSQVQPPTYYTISISFKFPRIAALISFSYFSFIISAHPTMCNGRRTSPGRPIDKNARIYANIDAHGCHNNTTTIIIVPVYRTRRIVRRPATAIITATVPETNLSRSAGTTPVRRQRPTEFTRSRNLSTTRSGRLHYSNGCCAPFDYQPPGTGHPTERRLEWPTRWTIKFQRLRPRTAAHAAEPRRATVLPASGLRNQAIRAMGARHHWREWRRRYVIGWRVRTAGLLLAGRRLQSIRRLLRYLAAGLGRRD